MLGKVKLLDRNDFKIFRLLDPDNGKGKEYLGHLAREEAAKQKLQIGIKKRVENCKVQSKKGDFLHMHYSGTLEDGTVFDSSYDRKDPLTFTLGSGQVIKGWDQGLIGMCEGEKRKLIIPPHLGYGEAGSPPTIPGGSTLKFEVELVKIERKRQEL